ncbi:MAG: LacI family DNA-binding transcriptional regulator [Pseudomonadota bacterium]
MTITRTKAPATLRQVAAQADVSVATVSRYLNKSLKVGIATEERILAAIADLRYKPNLLAQGLSKGKTMMIGVLTPSVTSPFYDHIQYGLEITTAKAGYVCVSASGDRDTAAQVKVLDILVGRRVDGVVILESRMSDALLAGYARQLPVVVLGRSIVAENLYSMTISHVRAAFDATNHLLALGHRDIVFIGGLDNNSDSIERLAGYRQALEAAGVPFRPEMTIAGEFTEHSGIKAFDTMQERGLSYTAVFAANDQTAYGLRLALYQRGIRVPEDVSIVGYDDLPGSIFCTPPLTTVRQQTYFIGEALGNDLLSLMTDTPRQTANIELELMVRQSTAAPAR